jgi:hypothetical protein
MVLGEGARHSLAFLLDTLTSQGLPIGLYR